MSSQPNRLPKRLSLAVIRWASSFGILFAVTTDALALGYAMVVPTFIFLSVALEGLSSEHQSRPLLVWLGMIVALCGAIGPAYIGFRLWQMGY